MDIESTNDVDKVTEQRMAELIGCTKRSLEHRRWMGRFPRASG